MPAPVQRDPETTAASIASWLGSVFPDAQDIAVTDFHAPPSSGFSGETLLVDAEWTEDGVRVQRPLVIRVAPTTYTVFLDPDFEAQYRTMKVLSEKADVPMPVMLAYEDDPKWLGGAFSLMDRIEGEAAPDSPAYTESGFIKEATHEQQAQLYESGLQAMAKVHNVDWRALGLDFLDRPERGAPGVAQELSYVEDWYAWATPGENPVMEGALAWVRANRPPDLDPSDVTLCWGDARPGNQLFHDFELVAVLDWEMVCLGDPIMDLGWWLFLERFHTEGTGVPLLPGFPGAHGAVKRWEELTGRTADPEILHFYIAFAGVRFGVVMMRLAALFQEFGLMPAEADMARNNPVLALLAAHLGLPAPG